MKRLVKKLSKSGALNSRRVKKAFLAVDRNLFVPADQKYFAYDDTPLPIGHDQTISQPSTVAFMLELLQAKSGEKILDVGFGSGWQTALLANMVGSKGSIYAVELVPEIFKFGQKNLQEFGCRNVYFKVADSKLGWPEFAPYDRIIVAAAADKPPEFLLRQLRVGGRCILPVKNSIIQIDRENSDDFTMQEFTGFRFVPLVDVKD